MSNAYSASRLAPVKPSASVVVSQHARALKSEGRDIIDLGIGEPDFDTPRPIIEAAYAAALAGQTRYTAMAGTEALRSAVADKFKRENDLNYALDQIMVSNGAKQIIFNALMATLEDGDEVLLCAPYFGVYKDIVLVLGGVPVTIQCKVENGFRLDAAGLRAAITPRTRWLILNLPSNPGGAVYSREQLQALGEVFAEFPRLMIMSDEIYEHIIFDDREFVSTAYACSELHPRILTVNGVSKAYAMTGWRIGYAAGPADLIAAMLKVQSQVSSAPSAVSQAAAEAALTGPQDEVRKFRDAFEARRNLVVSSVATIPGLELSSPGGAFYAYIGCAAFIGATSQQGSVIEDDVGLTNYLLEEAGVAAVAGSAFGLSPFFRISTATSETELEKAMNRIGVALARLQLKNQV